MAAKIGGCSVVLIVAAALFGCSRPPPPPALTGLPAIRQMLQLPEAEIDLATAKLSIDQLIEPTIDVVGAGAQLDAIAQRVRLRLPANPSSREKVDGLRAELYDAGPWNENQPFRYDLEDPFGHSIRNKLLPTYLATRRGNCVSMPLLFIALGQKVGIDVTASTAPDHVFVKYRDETGALFNLEATSGAGFTSDAWIQHEMPMTAEALSNGIYLQRLTKKETLVVMLGTLMEFYGQQGRQDEQIALARLALENYPKDVTAMLQIHAAFGRMIQREFQSKYRSPRDIPATERARFRELDGNSQLWRQKAEALGWREPDEATEDRYRETVNLAKSAQ